MPFSFVKHYLKRIRAAFSSKTFLPLVTRKSKKSAAEGPYAGRLALSLGRGALFFVGQIAGPASSPRGARVDARDLGIYAHIICLNLFENKVDVGFPPKNATSSKAFPGEQGKIQ
jgi:hypothetical protein